MCGFEEVRGKRVTFSELGESRLGVVVSAEYTTDRGGAPYMIYLVATNDGATRLLDESRVRFVDFLQPPPPAG